MIIFLVEQSRCGRGLLAEVPTFDYVPTRHIFFSSKRISDELVKRMTEHLFTNVSCHLRNSCFRVISLCVYFALLVLVKIFIKDELLNVLKKRMLKYITLLILFLALAAV